MDLEPVEIDMIKVIHPLRQHGQPAMSWTTAQRHADDVAHDLAELVQDCEPNQQVKYARTLLSVSPHGAYAKAMLIENDWQNVQSLIGQWEKESGDSPALLGALGRQYNRLGKLDQAENYLSRYLKLAPDDFWAYEMLASSYRSRGDIKRWQEILEESLKTEDTGLNHAKARVALADYYMSLGQWAKAEPFAEAAGETWAEWAMKCAKHCAEGRENWQRGEVWAQRISERYPWSYLLRMVLVLQANRTRRRESRARIRRAVHRPIPCRAHAQPRSPGLLFLARRAAQGSAQLVPKSLPEDPVRSELRRIDAGRRRDRRQGDT